MLTMVDAMKSWFSLSVFDELTIANDAYYIQIVVYFIW